MTSLLSLKFCAREGLLLMREAFRDLQRDPRCTEQVGVPNFLIRLDADRRLAVDDWADRARPMIWAAAKRILHARWMVGRVNDGECFDGLSMVASGDGEVLNLGLFVTIPDPPLTRYAAGGMWRRAEAMRLSREPRLFVLKGP